MRWGDAARARLLAAGPLESRTVDEYPRFAVRGIIEGFYGRPWSLEQRMDMIAFLGAHRMNTFVYSPKDDDYCRRRWHEPYPAPELAALSELVQEAGTTAVDVSYGLSPGLSIRYSDRADVDRLLAKFDQVCELGVHTFSCSSTTFRCDLQHPEDLRQFPRPRHGPGQPHRHGRRGLDALDRNIRLAVCPTLYNGRGDEPYLAPLGAQTDPRVDLLWTGRAICSPELDLADAAMFLRTTSRPVLYWDNYPVNDVAMTAELHLGAYRGRDPHLYRFTRGVLANPMERPESSKIALATIADYLWDPDGYDPDRSWDARRSREVAGTRDAEALRLFADNVRTSCLEEADSPLLTRGARRRLEFERSSATRGSEATPSPPGPTLRRLRRTHCSDTDVENPVLAAEIRPWVEAFAAGSATAGRHGGGPAEPSPRASVRTEPPMVFGDVLDMFVRSGARSD